MNEHEVATIAEAFNGLTQEQGSPVGLILQAELPFDAWKDRVRSLASVRSFSPFAVGDIFLYGMREYGEKRAYQQEAVRLADYSLKFIQKCAQVCEKIPFEYRQPWPLSFEHHVAVYRVKSPGCLEHDGKADGTCYGCGAARLQTIADWLTQARDKHWTARELKDEIAHANATKVREHQRALPNGEEFDPETLKEAVNEAKRLADEFKKRSGGLLTTKGTLDKGKAKVLNAAISELREALDALEELLS